MSTPPSSAPPGTTASFLKELLRRAVLEALTESDDLREVTGAHLSRALDDLLDSNQQITRALLGVAAPDTGRAAGGHGGLPGASVPTGRDFRRRPLGGRQSDRRGRP